MDDYKNYAYSTLTAGISAAATSCSVASGTGSRFPSTAFDAVIWDTSYATATAAVLAGAGEQVRVGVRSTDTFPLTRAQGGTSAVALNATGRTYAIAQVLTESAFEAVAPRDSPTFTGPITSSGARVATSTAMGSTVIDVTKLDNTYSATGDATLTFSATPATDTVFGVTVTTDSSTPTLTFPESQSANRGASITTATFPANMSWSVYWRKTASGYRIINDPMTAAQVKAALAITVDDVTGTLPVAKGGTGVTSPSLVAGTNISVTGTWPNQTVTASGGGGGSSNVVSGGAASTDFAFVETIASGNASTDFSTLAVVHGSNASVTF